jgi:signal transduction histidine kinase
MLREEVQIKEVFENVFSQLNFLINSIQPVLKMDLDAAPVVHVNKAYLESILLNLFTNSLKYHATDRTLKISVTTKETPDGVSLTFKDNGIGIDMARNKDKIFGLYQRFHNYPDSKGLGLYLVKSQIESMGGSITVESKVDKGTTFTLLFSK